MAETRVHVCAKSLIPPHTQVLEPEYHNLIPTCCLPQGEDYTPVYAVPQAHPFAWVHLPGQLEPSESSEGVLPSEQQPKGEL